MKKLFYVLLVILLSCSKEGGEEKGGNVVEYQMTSINTAQVNVHYTEANGEQPGLAVNHNWKKRIENVPRPFTAYIRALAISATGERVSCTVKILVDGVEKASVTDSGVPLSEVEARFTIE